MFPPCLSFADDRAVFDATLLTHCGVVCCLPRFPADGNQRESIGDAPSTVSLICYHFSFTLLNEFGLFDEQLILVADDVEVRVELRRRGD